MTTELLNLKVAKITPEAAGIISLELVDPENRDLPAFTAGSHIDAHLPNGLTRQYSLWNNPQEKNRYCLGVLRDSQSRGGSAAVHEAVHEGEMLTVSKPRNSFHLNEDADYSMLFAGGIGVTPILAMAQRLLTLGKPFEMHYCTRSRDNMAFYDMLSNGPFKGKVKFHFDDGPEEQLLDINNLVGDYRNGTNLYVCGPQGFMDFVIGATEKNWPAERVHREYFSQDPKAGHDDDESFDVKIASTGQVFQIPGDRNIVEVLEEEGFSVPVSCEQGVCGTCLTKVIDGVPDHRDVYLSSAEQAANNQMTLCCSRAKSPLLELDL